MRGVSKPSSCALLTLAERRLGPACAAEAHRRSLLGLVVHRRESLRHYAVEMTAFERDRPVRRVVAERPLFLPVRTRVSILAGHLEVDQHARRAVTPAFVVSSGDRRG